MVRKQEEERTRVSQTVAQQMDLSILLAKSHEVSTMVKNLI